MTVNWRRSASCGLGSSVRGPASGLWGDEPLDSRPRTLDGPTSAAPHLLQNFAVGRASRPQLGQVRASGVPHSSQNWAPASFSQLQLAQRIRPLYSFGDNNVPSLSSTSRMTAFGKAQMNSAFRTRQSKLFA